MRQFVLVRKQLQLFTNQLSNCKFGKEQFTEIRGAEFADYGKINNTDLLIGSDFYWGLVSNEVKSGKQDGLVVLDTTVISLHMF